MNETNFSAGNGAPIKAERIFDSCSDKDCLADLPVTLTEGTLPPNINIVRSRSAEVESVSVSVEPIPFNKGFFSIDVTFTFSLEILGYESSGSSPVVMKGTTYASKNCILYGSETKAITFSSASPGPQTAPSGCYGVLPRANVSVIEPIVLGTRIERCEQGAAAGQSGSIYATLGLFSVVELTRPVTIMTQTLDYSIPQKQCQCESDSPCDVFEKLRFPEEEFSPASLTEEPDDRMDFEIGSN